MQRLRWQSGSAGRPTLTYTTSHRRVGSAGFARALSKAEGRAPSYRRRNPPSGSAISPSVSVPAFWTVSLSQLAAVVRSQAGRLAPAGRIVGGLVADHRERDPVRSMRQRTSDHASAFATGTQPVGVGLGGRLALPHPHAQVEDRPTQPHRPLTADATVPAFSSGLIGRRGQPGSPIDLRCRRPPAGLTKRCGVRGRA